MIGTSVSLLTGSIQLIRRKRDAIHRRVGYLYAAVMAAGNLSALLIYRFTGGFNVFHALALYSLLNVAMALRPMLTHPRPYQWRRIHYTWVSWSYVGLAAAASTEVLARLFGLPPWLSAGAGSFPVVLLGWWLINHFAPPLRPPSGLSAA